VYEHHPHRFTVYLTIDSKFNLVKDMKNVMRFYQKETAQRLERSGDNPMSLPPFDQDVLYVRHWTKENLQRYFDNIRTYMILLQSSVASYILEQQPHLFAGFETPQRLWRRDQAEQGVQQDDYGDIISGSERDKLSPLERELWRSEETMWVEHQESTPSRLVVATDMSFMLRSYIHPAS